MIYLMMCKHVAYFFGEHNVNICTFAHGNVAEGKGIGKRCYVAREKCTINC